ncbi:type IV pilus assembly protein PilY1 [Candidatus Magnetomoraceae bacterium gMMP-15]
MKKLLIIVLTFVNLFFISPIEVNFADEPIMADYEAFPPFLSANVPPMVMLVMGRNHKLYYEAYNDASDLDGDGTLDIGYNPSIDYYGYFDSYKCYTYNDSANPDRFEPSSVTENKQCPGAENGLWSGDFLNYLTMCRMDTLRKVLYGGYRSIDTTSETVLERSFIPQDAHSWGKEYKSIADDGYDISDYTPLNLPIGGTRHLFVNTTLSSDSSPPLLRILENSVYRIWNWVAIERPVAGSQVEIVIGGSTTRITLTDNRVDSEEIIDVTDGGDAGIITAIEVDPGDATEISDDFNDGNINPIWTFVDHDNDDDTSCDETDGELVIDAGGKDIWTGSDEFGCLYLNDIEGDFDFKLKITEQEEKDGWGKTGIMVRNDMTQPGSSTGYCVIGVTPDNGFTFQYDSNNNGYLDGHSSGSSVSLPDWVRLQKIGTTFTGYYGNDGENWTQRGSCTLSSAASIQDVGIFVTSHKDNKLSKCKFDEMTLYASATTGGTDPAYAFDDDSDTKWFTTSEPSYANPSWIQFQFTSSKNILKYSLTTGNDAEDRDPKTWTLEASNNQVDWIIIDTVSNGSLPSDRKEKKEFICDNPQSELYTYYRFNITDNKGDAEDGIQIAEIEMMETVEAIPENATLSEYEVRVKVCDPSMLESNSKKYPNENYKPIGILQRHGESEISGDERMYFGLLTGSYTKNTSGGVLRKNVGSIRDEINSDTGQFTSTIGIIKTIDKFRIVDFSYSGYSYNSNCGWIVNGPISEGQCRMWGNPIGEMMYETLRYFGGKSSPTSNFTYGTDSGYDDNELGLPKPDWNDPYAIYDYCAKSFMLVLSDINPTYDSDQLPGSAFDDFTGDLTGLNVSSLANTISSQEGDTGSHFIGQNDSAFDGACTEKNIAGFGNIRGLCPEEPTKQGSYYSASISYHGNQEDLNEAYGIQNVITYSVGLASPLPNINIVIGGNEVTLVPFAKSVGGYSIGSDFQPTNTIVDFFVEIIEPTYGKFRINYEDVEQGADHDMDAIISYEYQVIDADGNPVNEDNIEQGVALDIKLTSEYAAGSIIQHCGYIISGTTVDGTYLEVRDYDTGSGSDPDYFLDTPPGIGPNQGSSDTAWDDDEALPLENTRRFWPDSGGGDSAAELLKTPLWYAAKWGGFEDSNNNGKPDLDNEWDQDVDGIPDTYFYVVNPLRLEEQLNKSFADILKKAGSGTAASVLATNSEGEGNLIQTYFQPVFTSGTNELKWPGYIQSLWVDSSGNMREDTVHDLKLNVEEDCIIKYFIDEISGNTRIKKYSVSQSNPYPDENDTYVELGLSEITPILEAGQVLSERSADDRKIFTFIDKDDDKQIDESSDPFDTNDEIIKFHIDSTSYIKPYLGVKDNDAWAYLGANHDDRVNNLINYIRGKDSPDLSGTPDVRTRTLANGDVWKLGDIVHSTPVAISKPVERYDLIYSDESYHTYYLANQDRESVIYVGANDGMLHAFTSWKYNSETGQITKPSAAATSEQIGDELWAYVPQSLLPHLKWLASPDYTHVYYVDLKPKIFDAQIDSQWKTLLLCGLNMGGKQIQAEGDFDYNTDTSDTIRSFNPVYFCMDITDPRNPILLWERSYTNLDMTSSIPAVIRVQNKWFAVFGSGPEDYDGTSSSSGYVFVVDIENGIPYQNLSEDDVDWLFKTDTSSSFMTSPIPIDNGLDGNVNAIYFSESYFQDTWKGKAYRLVTNGSNSTSEYDDSPYTWSMSSFFESEGPITIPVSLSTDSFENIWVYFGTGRYISQADKTNTDTQYLFGIKDPFFKDDPLTVLDKDDLFNVDNIAVTTDERVFENCPDSFGDYDCTPYEEEGEWDEFLAAVRAKNGWSRTLQESGERSVTKFSILGGTVFTSTYIPNDDLCAFGGGTNFYGLYYETGTAYTNLVWADDNDEIFSSIDVNNDLYFDSADIAILDQNADNRIDESDFSLFTGLTKESLAYLSSVDESDFNTFSNLSASLGRSLDTSDFTIEDSNDDGIIDSNDLYIDVNADGVIDDTDFNIMDVDNSGTVDTDDFNIIDLDESGTVDSDDEGMFLTASGMDLNADGTVDIEDFNILDINNDSIIDAHDFESIAEILDLDNSGWIDISDIEYSEDGSKVIDINDDDRIDLNEIYVNSESGTPVIIDGQTYNLSSDKITSIIGAPPPSIGMHVGQEEGAKAFIQQSTGQVVEADINPALNMKSGLTGWREK